MNSSVAVRKEIVWSIFDLSGVALEGEVGGIHRQQGYTGLKLQAFNGELVEKSIPLK